MSSHRPLYVSFVAFGLLVATCTGGDGEADPSTVPPTQPPPAPVTTVEPSPTTTALPPTTPPPTTTTLPSGLERQVLTLGFVPGDLATYEGTLETRLGWSGRTQVGVFGDSSSAEGDLITEWTGRQRLLALAADDSIELVEDFTADAGSVFVEEDGKKATTELTRDELLDFKPDTPPMIVDEAGLLVSGPVSGAPRALILPFDPLAAAAVVGPPFSSDPVDVGDFWTVEFEDQLLGTVVIDVEIMGERETDDGTYVFVIDFGGGSDDLPRELNLAEALDLIGAFSDGQGLESLLPSDVTGTVTVQSILLDGSVQFDPARGIAVELGSQETFAMDFSLEIGDETAAFSLEAGTSRSFVLTDYAPASPFDVESVLDRFEIDPFTLAAATFSGLTDYELMDITDEQADMVFEPLSEVRQDLFGGATIVNLVDGEGEEAIALSVTNGGRFRGAPTMAEEVAALLSGLLFGSAPKAVSIGDKTAYRVTIEGDEWLLYNNETHLFVTIGPRDLSGRIMADFVESVVPYLWQPGDCLDFTDGFRGEIPYAPFGIHGLRHCTVDHTYEVIYSEVLPSSRYPRRLNVRGAATCYGAFHDFTGRLPIDSSLLLTWFWPDEDEWEKGSRYLACMINASDSSGEVDMKVGRIEGKDAAYAVAVETGSCLSGPVPVPCDVPHTREVIAAFRVEAEPGAPEPKGDDLQRVMSDECDGALANFELGEGPGLVRVVEPLNDMIIRRTSELNPVVWELGSRKYYCLASAFGDDGFALNITGTFADGWEEAKEGIVT